MQGAGRGWVVSSDTGLDDFVFCCIVKTSSCILLHSVEYISLQYAFCRFCIVEKIHPTSCKIPGAMAGLGGHFAWVLICTGATQINFTSPATFTYLSADLSHVSNGMLFHLFFSFGDGHMCPQILSYSGLVSWNLHLSRQLAAGVGRY